MSGEAVNRAAWLVAGLVILVLVGWGEAGAIEDGDRLYLSSTSAGIVDGVGFEDEDIVLYDSTTGAWSLLFDGSDVGLPDRADIDAVHVVDDGDDSTLDDIYISLARRVVLEGVLIDDSDVVVFTPTSLGSDTAGSFAIYFDGSDVGLTLAEEDIDAFAIAPDGRLLISTRGTARVANPDGSRLAAPDEDVLAFAPDSLGEVTTGTWTRLFDGSDVGLRARSEDVSGVAAGLDSGELYLTTLRSYSTGGLSGDSDDVLLFTADSLGGATSGTFSVFFDGDEYAGLGAERLDAVSVIFGATLPPNTPPTAVDDGPGEGFATDEDSAFTTGSVLDNDSDPDGDSLSVESLDTAATLGSVTDNGDGTFAYDPAGAFEDLAVGEAMDDAFVYTISDGNGGTDTATVTILVAGRNDPPNAVDDAAATDEDTPVAVLLTGNDTDVDGDDLAIESVDTTGVAGLVTIEPDGDTITYDPNGQFEDLGEGDTAEESFTYVVADGNGGTDTAGVTISIAGVDDPNRDPVAIPDEGITDEDTVAGHVFALVIGGSELRELDSPRGVAVDPANGNILAADTLKNRVVMYDASGTPTGVVIEGLNYPAGVAIDPTNGNIVVAELWNFRVAVYDSTGAPTGVVIDGLDVPSDVAVDPRNGNIVIAESYGDRVVVYDNTGVATGVVIDGLGLPSGVAVDPANGNILVADSSADQVLVFDDAGNAAGVVGEGLSGPSDVTVAAGSGNIVVADRSNHRVVVYDNDGNATGVVVEGLRYPGGVAVDPPSGNIIIADTGHHRVAVFDADGEPTDVVISELDDPAGVAVDQLTRNIVVADAGNGQVVVYDSSGTATGTLITDLDRPTDVDVYPTTGDIVVADEDFERITFYDNLGNLTSEIYMDLPTSVAAHPSGNVFIGNPAVVREYERDGTYVQSFGVGYAADVDIDLATGNLIVADLEEQAVNVIGTLDLSIPVGHPEAAVSDPTTGNIVVGDTGDGRVMTFDLTGAVAGPDIAGLGHPDGVDVDPATGNIVVADLDRVIVFETSLLANDTDPDGDSLTVTGFDAISAEGATVMVDPDGTYRYDPTTSVTLQALAAGESHVDTFSYTVSDGNGGSATAIVTIAVAGRDETNTAPVANPDEGITDEEIPASHVFDLVIEPGVLARPQGAAVDPNTGNIVVADTGNRRVVVFEGDGTPTGTVISDLGWPGDVAVVPATSSIVVADTSNDQVVVFDAAGVATGVVIPGFDSPQGVAVDPATGNIVVADTDNDRVVVYDGAGAPTGTVITDVASPWGVAVDPQTGNIVVADTENNRVIIFDGAGVPTGTVISDLDLPFDVSVDPATGNILVAVFGSDQVAAYDSTGAPTGMVIPDLGSPYGVDVDPATGNILVADAPTGVIVFDSTGVPTGDLIANRMDPTGVAIDPATGNIVVADAFNSRVVIYDSDGVPTGTVLDGLSEPAGVAVDAATSDIAVANTGGGEVVVYHSDGTPTGFVVEPDFSPFGVAFGPSVRWFSAYIIVGEGPAVSVYDSEGTRIIWDNDFSLPLDVAVDPATGNTAVAELGGPSVTVWHDGQTSWIDLPSPEAVAFDPTTGNVVVGDTVDYRVMTFALDGTPLGPVIAGLSYPDGVAVDATGRIVVADTPRVVVFGRSVLTNDTDPDGDPLTVTDFDALSVEGATVVVNPDGTYVYDPSTSDSIQALGTFESLIDTFAYTVGDGRGGSATATVTIEVWGVS